MHKCQVARPSQDTGFIRRARIFHFVLIPQRLCRPAHRRSEVSPGRRLSVSADCVGVTERSLPWGSSIPTCTESDTRSLRAPKGFCVHKGTMHAVSQKPSMCVVRSPTTKIQGNHTKNKTKGVQTWFKGGPLRNKTHYF